ncbi:hypothetical protein [Aquimarina rhabdastrellae]
MNNYNLYKEESSQDVTKLPLYMKALDIFKLNRSLVAATSEVRSLDELDHTASRMNRRLSNLITTGLLLIKHIALAETSRNTHTKAQYIASVEFYISSIEADYYALKQALIHREPKITKLLTSEIKSLKELHWTWSKRYKKI